MAPDPCSSAPVVLARRPSTLQVGLLLALGVALAALTMVSTAAIRDARSANETLARVEFVAREVTDIEVMTMEAFLLTNEWSSGRAPLKDVERELALIEQKARSMTDSSRRIGFEDELAVVVADVEFARQVLPGLRPIEAHIARDAIAELRNVVRYDLTAKLTPTLEAASVSTDSLGDLFVVFAAIGALAVILMAAIVMVAQRDVRRNYDRGHAALVELAWARKQAEKLNLAQVELAELIAGGVERDLVAEQGRVLLDDITGRTWNVIGGSPIAPDDGAQVSAEEEAAIRAFERLLAVATERDRLHRLLTRRALHDELTGLRNRAGLVDRLEHAMARRQRDGEVLAVLFVDLDRFKQVNDSFGHRAGDELLTLIGERLGEVVRKGDTVSRPGGDEFVVVLDAVQESHLASIAERIHGRLIEPVQLEAGVVSVGASVGVYEVNGTEIDADDVLRRADAAMYEAKAGSGGVVIFDESLRAQADGRVAAERDVRRALDADGFDVHFQPVFETTSGRVVCVEALVRWDRDGALLLPAEFIEVAEESGLIVGIDNQVLIRACEAFAAWDLPADVRLAVNFAGRTLSRPELVADVARVLGSCGLGADRLTVEVRDEMILRLPESAAVVQSLREMGVRVALDDFGTGLTSMANLESLPVDMLKIDRSLIRRLSLDSTDPVVAALVSVGQGVGLTVVAEGVETTTEAEALTVLGCTLHQGFLYAHPVARGDVRLDALPGGVGRESC